MVKASTLAQAGLTCDVRLAGVTPEVWLRVRANTDVGPGRSIVVDGTVADVSAERAAAVRLASEAAEAAERAEELAAIDRTRAALLAAAGHDLRTPLTVAASAVSGLRQPNLPAEERSELLDNVAASVERLVTTLTDLLDLSRSEAGALPVRLTPVPVLETLEQPLRGMGSGVVLDLPEDLPDVLADASLLERVLDNLLRNADRHRPPGTAVTVAARVEGGRVLLQVIDHGPGVPPEQYEAMFAPFQHLTEGGSGGLGLGLSIARAFTMAMHGRLTPSETPGGGLTMTLDPSAV